MSEAILHTLQANYGGTIPFARAATLLCISERALLQRLVNGEVLALDHLHQYHFPMFQFKGNGMIPGLSEILKVAKAPTEEVLDYLLDKSIGGLSTIDLLREGITEAELHALIEEIEDFYTHDLAPIQSKI